MVFMGSAAELLETFVAAGWHVADRVTPQTAVRAFARGVLDRPYPSAPVLPVFLDGRLHTLAFQRHDEGGSSRRRHHARWWLTDFTCEGKQVWVATASFDAGVGIGRLFPLPIHHIDPDIDAERDYIVRSLVGYRPAASDPEGAGHRAHDRQERRRRPFLHGRRGRRPGLVAAGPAAPHPPSGAVERSRLRLPARRSALYSTVMVASKVSRGAVLSQGRA